MPEYSPVGPAAGPGDLPDGATASTHAESSTAHPARDHKWPWPARLLVAVALLPVGAAVILAAENAFTSAVGRWFGPLMATFMVVAVLVAWPVTGRGQR